MLMIGGIHGSSKRRGRKGSKDRFLRLGRVDELKTGGHFLQNASRSFAVQIQFYGPHVPHGLKPWEINQSLASDEEANPLSVA